MPWKPSQPAITSQSELDAPPAMYEMDCGRVAVKAVHAHVVDLELERQAGGERALR